LKVVDLIRLLEADGWQLVRTRGSHRQYKHPSKRGLVTVSGKPSSDIPRGTLNSVMKQAWPEPMSGEMMRYTVILERGDASWGVHVPDLPGCVAAGETREEALVLIREAIALHITGLREEGLPVPEARSEGDVIEVRAAS
jgi:predicted RNA binding protein YcfA (HicA-like mRNA interferase family)/predicted RNase H-like HicB family nuclease